jgi:putative endonuclease
MSLVRSSELSWAMSGTRSFIPTAEWEDLRQIRGLWGERTAIGYLVSCGWDIEAHRFKLGRHDIDLVARRGNMVAFVEVKTRRSVAQGGPVESVGRRKQSTIAKVASVWCLRYGRPNDEYRFDVVAVQEHGRGQYTIDQIEDAWRCQGSSRRTFG